ncbi:MAG: hypothetical protein Q8P88_01615 [Candidatus Jorgensenbacteria bacterium]|nr:hypothetical protein [Candidatus Jorgensenbacteria bacterium]
MKTAIFFFLTIVFLIAPFSLALADGHTTVGGQTITLKNPLGEGTTFTSLLDKILDFLIKAGAIIASIMVVIGAFQILFAAGDPEKFITGRRTIVYTVIAYGILLMAKGVTLIIKNFFSIAS